MVRVSRNRFLSLFTVISSITFTSAFMHAQATPDNSQLQGKQAVHAVVQHVLFIPNITAPKTGKQLPTDGHWLIGTDTPPACSQAPAEGNRPCLRVIYSVPDAEVTCEWVVLLDQDGANGAILEQNDDATHYFMQKLSANEAKPLVIKRSTPVYPAIAEAAHVQGDVKLQVIVGPDGKPATVTVISGNGMLTGAARDAVRGWTFKPFQIGTRTVSFQTEVTFHYTTAGMNLSSISSTP